MIEPVGLHNMALKTSTQILGQNKDIMKVGMNAIAERDIYQPIFSADGNRGLAACHGEREKACSSPTAKDDGQDFRIVI